MATKKKSAKKKSTKKKVTVKKKTAVKKTVVKPAGKRYFRLDIGGRGGEAIIGEVTKEFVEYWKDNSDGLTNHMYSLTEVSEHLEYSPEDEDFEYPEDFDKNSPAPKKGSLMPYFEYDSVEHETGVSTTDSAYNVKEIKLNDGIEFSGGELSVIASDDDDEDVYIDEEEKYEVIASDDAYYEFRNQIYSRELYVNSDKSEVEKPIPVVAMYDAQKGGFGHAYVETDGEDFDPKKISFGTLETSVGDIITDVFYDKKSIYINTDSLNTWGKGFFAVAGYLSKSDLKFDRDAWIKEGFENLDEE